MRRQPERHRRLCHLVIRRPERPLGRHASLSAHHVPFGPPAAPSRALQAAGRAATPAEGLLAQRSQPYAGQVSLDRSLPTLPRWWGPGGPRTARHLLDSSELTGQHRKPLMSGSMLGVFVVEGVFCGRVSIGIELGPRIGLQKGPLWRLGETGLTRRSYPSGAGGLGPSLGAPVGIKRGS